MRHHTAALGRTRSPRPPHIPKSPAKGRARPPEKTCLEILGRPEMRDKLVQSGFEVQAKSGADHMARVVKEVPMFREIIAQAGIQRL